MRSSDRCDLGVVIGWRYFDDIGAHDVQWGHSTQDCEKFSARHAASLWSPSSWSVGRVEDIDIDADVYRSVPHTVENFGQCTFDTDRVKFSTMHDREAQLCVVIEIGAVVERTADSDVCGAALADQIFFSCAAEWCSVRARRPEERVPSVEVSIEVNQSDWPMDGMDGAESGQGNRMVTTEQHDTLLGRSEMAVSAS
jgi:hypothetical protein